MRKTTVVLLALVVLLLGAASCRQLPAPRSADRGALQTEEMATTDAIPLEYGNLVAVTPLPENPYHAGLWFEKPDKTIVFVKVNYSLGKIQKDALLLPRR